MAVPAAPALVLAVGAGPIINPIKQRIRDAFLALGNGDPLFAARHTGRVSCPRREWLSKLETFFQNNQIGGGGINECWIVPRKDTIQITRQEHGITRVLRRTSWTRVMAYLANPTAACYAALNHVNPVVAPFVHTCSHGFMNNDSHHCCINGFDHGGFSTRAINENRKLCLHGAACLCPHQPRCVFVHKTGPLNGWLKPCLNHATHVPQCHCADPCF